MGKKGIGRRVYTKEFKAEAVVLAEKKEKPISQVAKDLGINENMLRRWIQASREAVSRRSPVTDGHGTLSLPARGKRTRLCGTQMKS